MEAASIGEAGGENAARRILPMRVFLEDIRSPFNVGSIFRTAESFGVAEIVLSPACPTPDHPRAARSAMGCAAIVPWRIGELLSIPRNEQVFVLELGGTPIGDFAFPPRGTVVVGNEELGASPEARSMAERSAGRVTIPLHGVKGSLNVSAAFAILLHSWFNRIG
jgi:TrmH family RNA methyltransferase